MGLVDEEGWRVIGMDGDDEDDAIGWVGCATRIRTLPRPQGIPRGSQSPSSRHLLYMEAAAKTWIEVIIEIGQRLVAAPTQRHP